MGLLWIFGEFVVDFCGFTVSFDGFPVGLWLSIYSGYGFQVEGMVVGGGCRHGWGGCQ